MPDDAGKQKQSLKSRWGRFRRLGHSAIGITVRRDRDAEAAEAFAKIAAYASAIRRLIDLRHFQPPNVRKPLTGHGDFG